MPETRGGVKSDKLLTEEEIESYHNKLKNREKIVAGNRYSNGAEKGT